MEITLILGEIRLTGTNGEYACNTWFDYIKDDKSLPISDSDVFSVISHNEIGDPDSAKGRELKIVCSVVEPVTIRFSQIVKRKNKAPLELYFINIELNEKYPVISLSGLYGFGGFKGSAKARFDLIDEDINISKRRYSYKQLSPDRTNETVKKRNVFF